MRDFADAQALQLKITEIVEYVFSEAWVLFGLTIEGVQG
jgi:hypothetical protein